MTSNAHDAYLAKVIINIQCKTLFPKHKSRLVCTGIHIYETTSLQDWFYSNL